MGKIVVVESLSLDGVMQAPGRPDEDTRGGFERGGWAVPYGDETMGRAMAESMGRTGAILLGRRTYESLYAFWPHQPDNPFTTALNDTRKYVASTSLAEPLPWVNSTLLTGDVMQAVAELRRQEAQDIVVIGSGELVGQLARHGLVDRYLLLIHPLVLGSGRRLFPEGWPETALRLTDPVTTATGVVIGTYEVAAA